MLQEFRENVVQDVKKHVTSEIDRHAAHMETVRKETLAKVKDDLKDMLQVDLTVGLQGAINIIARIIDDKRAQDRGEATRR